MASERALAFAKKQIARVFGEGSERVSAFGLMGGEIWTSIAGHRERLAVDARAATAEIAAALDAYEASAWVEITDDVATWPPQTKRVMFWRSAGYEVCGHVLHDDGADSFWLFDDDQGGDCATNRPTHWRPMPAEPESDQLIDRLARWLRWRDRRLQEVNTWLGLLKMAIDLRYIPRDDPDRRLTIPIVRRLATLQRLHTARLALSDAGRVRA